MTQAVFKYNLKKAFKKHMFMNYRDKHTINELLYILEHDIAFKEMDFNISICNLEGHWTSIPCLDAFVTVQVRGMWFEDDEVKFEVEEYGDEQYNCITIYESEEA